MRDTTQLTQGDIKTRNRVTGQPRLLNWQFAITSLGNTTYTPSHVIPHVHQSCNLRDCLWPTQSNYIINY